MSSELTKNELRKIFKAKRASLSSAEIEISSEKILKKFQEFFLKNSQIFIGKKIGLYIENKGEVAVFEIAKFLFKNSIKICYPRIVQKDLPLEFIESKPFFLSDKSTNEDISSLIFQGQDEFQESKFFKNIFEPKFGRIVEPDILLIPLLAFDNSGLRLGMGGGFYDRTLQNLRKKNPNFLAIGLAFDWQFCEKSIPFEVFDEKLDLIICESKIFLRTCLESF